MLKRIANVMLEIEALYSHLPNVTTKIDKVVHGQWNTPDETWLLLITQEYNGEKILEVKIPREEKATKVKAFIWIRYDLLDETKKKEIVQGRFEALNANVDQ